jgi:hypothetical protein
MKKRRLESEHVILLWEKCWLGYYQVPAPQPGLVYSSTAAKASLEELMPGYDRAKCLGTIRYFDAHKGGDQMFFLYATNEWGGLNSIQQMQRRQGGGIWHRMESDTATATARLGIS